MSYMANVIMNRNIRADIQAALSAGAKVDTRDFTRKLAAKYCTTPQRVCGNLSWLKRCGAIRIFPNPPHSIAYL